MNFLIILSLLFVIQLNSPIALSNQQTRQDYDMLNEQCELYGLPKLVYQKEDDETFAHHINEIINACSSAVAKQILSIINRLKDPNCPSRIAAKKLLIIGPAGVGKSTLAKGIARLAGRPYKFIKATELLTKYQNSGCENITREIRSVIDLNEPYVIIIDEINCLFDDFNKEQEHNDKKTATALWLAIDECCEQDNILFIGITNEDKMPKPLETRFVNHKIEMSLPSFFARKKIIQYYLKDLHHKISLRQLLYLSARTYGMGGRELEEMVNQALVLAYERNPRLPFVLYTDLKVALNIIRPHGIIIKNLNYVWKNKKDLFVRSLPYTIPVALALAACAFQCYLWTKQKALQETGLGYQHQGLLMQSTGLRLQESGLAYQKSGLDMQSEGLSYQKEGAAMQKQALDYQKTGIDLQLMNSFIQAEGYRLQHSNFTLQTLMSKYQVAGWASDWSANVHDKIVGIENNLLTNERIINNVNILQLQNLSWKLLSPQLTTYGEKDVTNEMANYLNELRKNQPVEKWWQKLF